MHENILRRIREQERILKPGRELYKLFDSSIHRTATELKERERLLQSMHADLPTSYDYILKNLQPELERMKEIRELTKETAAVADAHNSLSLELSRYAIPDIDVLNAINVNPSWAMLIEPYSNLDTIAASELALKSHLSGIAESAFLAQERMLQVYPDRLGLAAGFTSADVIGLRDLSSLLAEEYNSLFRSFENSQLIVPSLPPIVSSGPSIELLTSAKLLGSLSTPVDDYEKSQIPESSQEQEVVSEIEASLDELLMNLDPELRTLWRGAKEAFKSANPDRVRHIVVSLRELVGHVLRLVAPDEGVQSWTSDPAHFHEGRPTRASRVLYVCRDINHGPFTKFVAADVKASIECINLFQRGTHKLNINFSEYQVQTLILRTEALLRFVLLTSGTAG